MVWLLAYVWPAATAATTGTSTSKASRVQHTGSVERYRWSVHDPLVGPGPWLATVHDTAMDCPVPAAAGAAIAVGTRSGAVTVKTLAPRAAPVGVVTVTGPVEAPTGTRTTSRVVVLEETAAAMPLNVTMFSPAAAENPVPETVTVVPKPPAAGATPVIDGPPGPVRIAVRFPAGS